jgi:hypothetical protein|nr:MAG TPA: hypothetical protein [Caudoviricetes sp.]
MNSILFFDWGLNTKPITVKGFNFVITLPDSVKLNNIIDIQSFKLNGININLNYIESNRLTREYFNDIENVKTITLVFNKLIEIPKNIESIELLIKTQTLYENFWSKNSNIYSYKDNNITPFSITKISSDYFLIKNESLPDKSSNIISVNNDLFGDIDMLIYDLPDITTLFDLMKNSKPVTFLKDGTQLVQPNEFYLWTDNKGINLIYRSTLNERNLTGIEFDYLSLDYNYLIHRELSFNNYIFSVGVEDSNSVIVEVNNSPKKIIKVKHSKNVYVGNSFLSLVFKLKQ